MQRVTLPGGVVVDFPDGMTPDQMQPLLAKVQGVGAQPSNGQLPYEADTWEQAMEAKVADNLAKSRIGRRKPREDMSYLEAQERVLSRSLLPNVEAGLAQAGQGFLSLGARLTGFGDADAINRESDVLSQAADAVSKQDSIPDILQRGVRGVAATVPQAIVGGLPLGPAGAIAMGAASEANRAVTEARDRGLPEDEVMRYAAVRGGIEGAIAGTLQKFGLGGAEQVFKTGVAKQLAKQGVKEWLKTFGKQTMAELGEENLTELSHLIAERALIGDEDSEITPGKVAQTVADTTVQTLMTMGLMQGAATAAGEIEKRSILRKAAQRGHKPVAPFGEGQPVLNPPEQGPEPQIADKPSPLDRPNPGPAPPQDVSVPPPAAEEESDVAQDPGEEVIPDDLPEETVQRGPQGQVAEPASGPQLFPETGVPNQAPVPEQLVEPNVRSELEAMTPEEVEQIWRQEIFTEGAPAPSKSEMIDQLTELSAAVNAPIHVPVATPNAAPATSDVAQDELPTDVAPAQSESPVAQPEPEPAPGPVVAPEAVQEPVATPKTIGKQKPTRKEIIEQYQDTRGSGVQYHGASRPIEGFEEGYYSSDNIYGNGFYTTDSVGVAASYQGKNKGDKPNVVRISELKPVKLLDLDQPIDRNSPEGKTFIETIEYEADLPTEVNADYGLEYLKDHPNATYTQVIEEIRIGSHRDEFQDMMYTLRNQLEQQGYGGLSHVGGRKTKTGHEHQVRIYWTPETDLAVGSVELDEFRPQAEAPKKKLGKQATKPAPEPNPEPVATPEPTTEPLYESLGDDGTKAQVFAVDGGYSVSVYDPESGERLPSARIYKDLERAKAHADTIEVKDRPTVGKKKVKAAPTEVPPAEPDQNPSWKRTRVDVALGAHESLGIDFIRKMIDESKGSKRKQYQKEYDSLQKMKSEALDKHEADVAQAVKEGKAVPDNVLADYPQLTKKAEVTEPPAEPAPEAPPKKRRIGKRAEPKVEPVAETKAEAVPQPAVSPVVRQTPAKGTPERDAMDAELKAADDAYNAASEAAAKARADRDKSGYGTKRREQLERKFDKLNKASDEAFQKYRDLTSQSYQAKLEDAAESKDPVEAAVARFALNEQRDPGKTGKDLRQRRKDVEDIVRPRLAELAPAAAFNAEGAGLLPADEDAALVQREVDLLANDVIQNPLSAGEKLSDKLQGRIRGERLRAYRQVAKKQIGEIKGLESQDASKFSRKIDDDYSFDSIQNVIDQAKAKAAETKKQVAAAKKLDKEMGAKFVFSRDLGVVKPKNVTDRGLPGYLKSVSSRYNLLGTAKETGIATDGRMAFRLFGKDKAAVDKAEDINGRSLSQRQVDDAMAMDRKKSYSSATVVGARAPISDSEGVYLLESESGSRLVVDAKLLNIIRTRYPNATMEIADKKPYEDKVYFRQDGEIVAVLMPFNEKSPVLESENAEDDAEQDEPKQGDLAMMGTPVHVGVNRIDAKTGGEIRAADIVTTWSRLFNVPIKIGGFRTAAGKGKRKLGIYRHLEEIVLLAEPNAYDIVVASHEIAHHIDKKLDATGKMLSNLKATNKPLWRTVRSQLKALDYNPRAGRVFEGFAELTRHLLTGDRSVAPEAMTWLRGTVLASDPKLSAAMDKAIEHADKYAGMGFMERARSIFGGPARDLEWKEVKKRELLRSVDKLYQNFVDRHWFVKKVSDKIQERGGFSQDATMYDLLMAFDGTANAHAAMALMEGITTVSKTRRKLSGSLAEILDPITSEEEYLDAQAYAVAKHTLEVPGEYNTSMSVDDAQAVVDWVKSDPDRFDKFDKFATGLTAYNNALLDFLYDAGRISKEDLDRMLSAHGQTYVPLLREVDDDRRRVGSGGLVTMPKAVPSRSKRGSGRPVRDLIESTILRTQRFYRQAMNQQIIEALVRNADPKLGGVEGMGEFISRLDPGMKNFTGTLEEVLDDLVKEGWVSPEDAKASKLASKFKSGFGLSAADLTFLANRYGLPATADEADVAPYLDNELDVDLQLAFWRPDYRLPNGDYAIRHVVDGETVMYRLDKDFYEAIGGMDPTSSGVFFEVLRRVQAPFKVGAVGLSTGFAVQNIVRDALTATVNSQETEGAKRITKPFEWAGRYIAAVTNANPSEIVDLFREYGGELYSAIGSDRDDLRRFRQKIMKVGVLARIKGSKNVRGGMKEVADVTESYIDHVRQLVAWSDVGPRLAEVEGRLKRAGYEERGGKLHNIATGKPEVPPRDVIVQAMNAGGDVTYNYRRSGRVVKQHVEPFLPFTNALVQSVDKSARVLKSMLGDIGSKGLSGKRARQAAVALAVMTTADIVFTMLTKGDDDEEQDAWLKYGYFTSGTGNETNKRLGKSREYSFLPNLISATLNGGTPELYEAMSHEAVNRMPNGGGILWAMAEVARNWSSFRDRPLEPQYMMDDPVAMRTTKYTLETSNIAGKVAAKFPMLAELSPIEIEHLMNGASGGAYRRWVGFGERALASIGLKQGEQLKKEDIPFYRGFIVDRLQDVSVDEFYDQKDKVLQDSNFAKGGGDVTGFRDNRLKYERFLQYETLMKILREGKSDDYNPQVNVVALSRDALGKQPLASYPHPLYHQELPEAVRTEILKTVVREVRQVAEALDRPTEPGDKLDKWIIAEEAAQAFIKEHAESPFVKEAIEQVRTSESVRSLIRGQGRPRTIGKRGEADFTNRVKQFDAKREAALQFLEAFPQ